MKQFKVINTPDLLDIILKETKRGDEALFYLLNKRLRRYLKIEYEKMKELIDDSFEDTISEYYLYLHDYGSNEDSSTPYYQPLRRIKDNRVFAHWTMRTYCFFLNGKVKKMMMTPLFDNLPVEQPADSVKNWERRIWDMAVLIVCAYQTLKPLTKFIFFRSMLKVMDKKLCVPNKLMAQTLQISYIDYRIRSHHAWQMVRNKRKRMMDGERISLDSEGITMAKRIFTNYGSLLPTLRMYYMEIIETLPAKDLIKAMLAAHEKKSF